MADVTENDVKVDEYLRQCVELEPEALQEEYSRLSGDYAHWNQRFKDASRDLLMAEFEETKVAARLRIFFKESVGPGGKPPTEATVEAHVVLAPDYEAAHLKAIEAQVESTYLKGVMESLRTKREMLVSLGAHVRQELQGDLRLLERNELQRRARQIEND